MTITANTTDMMTDSQKNYLLNVLLKDKKIISVNRAKWIAQVNSGTLNKKEASALITEVKTLPWMSKAEKEEFKSMAESTPTVAVFQGEQGFYQGGSGVVYSYLQTNKGYKAWKRLVEKVGYKWEGEGYVTTKKGSYVKVYSGSAKKDINDGGKKLTMEEVTAHGSLMGYCLCCGRVLSDPKSVEAKIGPVCEKNYGHMFATLGV